MKKFRVYVTYKPSVFDPQGDTITDAARDLGYKTVNEIHVGKFFDIEVDDSDGSALTVVNDLAEKLLVNFNLEVYRCEELGED